MQSEHDTIAVNTAPQPQQSGTGPGADTTTGAGMTDEQGRAMQQAWECTARANDALAEAMEAEIVFVRLTAGSGDRAAADRVALLHKEAAHRRELAAQLRHELAVMGLPPGRTLGALTAAAGQEPRAVITITVRRDQIAMRALLQMGATLSVTRCWERSGRAGWGTRQPEFQHHEDLLGIELAEFMDAIDLPVRVANMLPRKGSPTAALDAAREVGRD